MYFEGTYLERKDIFIITIGSDNFTACVYKYMHTSKHNYV